MEGGGVQKLSEKEKQEEDNRRRSGEERSDCDSSERPATPNEDDGRAETEYRRTEERTSTDAEHPR